MAVIYYPKNQLMFIRDTTVSASNFESVVLNVQPNTVLYFDTTSLVNNVNAQQIPITASWALTASLSTVIGFTVSASWASSSISASIADTASFALNANASPSASWASSSISASYSTYADSTSPLALYTTISTSSLRWITCSYLIPEQFVSIGTSASYNFTCSDVPSAGQVATVTLYINNTAAFTSSLSFPSDWVFMGSAPTYISTSKAAILSLKNYGGALNVAAFTVQY